MDRLLERDTVLAELDRCRRTAARSGRIVLLRGEAGVGKTAVIARFSAGLVPGTRVLRGWCDALATPRPLGPLIDMLAGLAGERAARVRAAIDAGDSEAIYARLLDLFTDGARWVCVIEDLHWADGATLDLLRYLARRIDALPVMLVVSYRDDEIGPQHPLAVLLGDLATSAAVTRIPLAPLSATAVAQLAAGSGINADALYQITGGNPFFVTEVLAAGPDALAEGGLPRSVSEAVAGRLARLSPSGREIAHATAVCGPRTSPALVKALCPGAAAALTECLDAGVLVADADTVGFRHELARRGAAEQIPDFQRKAWHKRALTALAEPPIDPNMLAALAFHAEQADDTDAVIRYAPAGAERASALGANRQATQLYALALRHADAVPAGQKALWLERHAFCSYLCGLADAALASWHEAIALRRKLGDRLAEGEDLIGLSRMLAPLGRTAESIETGRAALRLLEDLGPTPQLAWSLINVAHAAALTLDPDCVEYSSRARALGIQLDEPAVVLRARGYLAMMSLFGSGVGWDEFETVWRETLREPAMAEHAGVLGVLICWTAVLRCELDRAEAYISEMSAFCDELDLGMFRALTGGSAALAALYRGDWTRAAVVAEQIVTRPELTPQHRIGPLVALALVHARCGSGPVWPLLDEALEYTADGPLGLQVWAARAEAAWLSGDDVGARTAVAAGMAAAGVGANPWLIGRLQRHARLAGVSPSTPDATAPVTPYQLEVCGDWRTAAAEWACRGCPYDAAVAQLGGDVDAVTAALGTFRQLGARTATRRAQQRLAQLRGRSPDQRRKDTCTDPHGLTKRQRDVLELLAAGHRDAEIAAALYISPKTVNTHVCAIMTKLGVHNRTQAAAYALQRQTASSG
ncbi:MAG TPA: AAA family ATPase [Mycobacterium sp.]|nr:AAA family ATPase [Mycobacterium sp.]